MPAESARAFDATVRPRRRHRRTGPLAVLWLCVLAACSTLPKDVERRPSTALTDTDGTKLGRLARASAPDAQPSRAPAHRAEPAVDARGQRVLASSPSSSDEDQSSVDDMPRSGFRLVGSGEDAFSTLYTLIRNAERSLDLQYYIIEDDAYSRTLLRAAREAAERGVRVRLLVDDLYTTGRDDRIAWYAAHPNIEVRVFNPFGKGRPWLATRFLASIADVARINHRMHNKLFVADNAFAVTGGRNLGAAYYTRSDKTNFLDLDVLASGPAVHQLSDVFDRYWNSPYAYPIDALIGSRPAPEETIDSRALNDPADPVIAATRQAEEHGAALQGEIDSGRLAMTIAPARVFADRPSKVDKSAPKAGTDGLRSGASIATDVAGIAKTAQHDLVIVTPYFVPGQRGVEMLRELVERGIHVRILTNSLAATDAAIVHIGYAHYRKALLALGVELYELKPTPGKEAGLSAVGSSKASLHAKLIVVDAATTFVGSFNVDQRSVYENTEMGVEIRSDELAGRILERLRERGPESRYQVRLDSDDRIEWVTEQDGVPQVLHDEPGASGWLELTLKLIGPFAPEELL